MFNFSQKIKNWKSLFHTRNKYTTMSRQPFYDIAKPYLPKNSEDIILDIGAGVGEFAEQLSLYDKYSDVVLLDANSETVNYLEGIGRDALLYKAPERLPFDDASVTFIHSSHMVEHLIYTDLYSFLKELDRVLADGGVLVISTPILWEKFYGDLSHIKPYYPGVFKHYLCSKSTQRTAKVISHDFEIKDLIYRYTDKNFDGYGSDNMGVDFIIYLFKKVAKKLGIKKYQRNGYTLILQKNTK